MRLRNSAPGSVTRGSSCSSIQAAPCRREAEAGLELGSAAQLIRADVMAATERRQIPWDHSAGAGQLILVPGERKP
jgi:hypothetical protein